MNMIYCKCGNKINPAFPNETICDLCKELKRQFDGNKEYPDLPDEVKDKVTFIHNDNHEIKNVMREAALKNLPPSTISTNNTAQDLINGILIEAAKRQEDLKYNPDGIKHKIRKGNNKKKCKRKKAVNGKTKKRRK